MVDLKKGNTMFHSTILSLHHTTALSQLRALSQQSPTTNLSQAPLFQTARRHQALITSPVILLMLAACSGSSNEPVSANPAATDNGDNGGGNRGDGDSSTSPSAAGSAPTVAQVLQEFKVFRSVEGNDTIAGPTYNAVSYAGDPAGVPVDPDDDDANPANVINGVDVNLTVGQAIDGWNDTDTLVDIELVHGSAYDDSLVGNENNNRLLGGAGNDLLTGQGGYNLLNGGAGNDVFVGSEDGINVVTYHTDPGGVFVYLQATIDPVFFPDGGSYAKDGWGNRDTFVNINHIVGSFYADTIYGNSSDNNLRGGHGNDFIYGLDGDDTLVGGYGSDWLDGGRGYDFVSYLEDIDGVIVNLLEERATDGWGYIDWIFGIESVHGSEYNDTIIGDDEGNILTGAAGDDIINGGAGNDNIEGGDGSNTLSGGEGFDSVSYEFLETAVTASLADGKATHGDSNEDDLDGFEAIVGSAFDDILIGDENDNGLIGNDGDDILIGGDGVDDLDGGAGSDWVSYKDDSAGVNINLARGTARDDWGNDDILTSIENAEGSAFDDTITGNDNMNTIIGGEGLDRLDGGHGID